MNLIKVHVLQVNLQPENIKDLTAAVDAGHTDDDGWQMPKGARTGDLAIWYMAGRQEFVARGWVEGIPWKVEHGHGPYRGSVAGVQWIDPVDRTEVIDRCGFDGGRQSYQTVSNGIAANFLRSLGLLA